MKMLSAAVALVAVAALFIQDNGLRSACTPLASAFGSSAFGLGR